MTAETTTEIAAGMSAATTGAATPNTMTVARPAKEAVWAVFLAMWSAVAITVIVLAIVAGGLLLKLWPDPVKTDLVKTLLWIALSAQFCVAILTVSLASSRLGQVKASAGPVNVDIEGTAS